MPEPRLPFTPSRLGYGMWGLADWSSEHGEDPRQALDRAVELGCTFFDTALAYGDGASERILGELLRRHPSRGLIAATKVPPLNGRWPARAQDAASDAFPLEHVLDCAERSRANLGVDVIDLLQLHAWTDAWAADPGWRTAVERLKSRGLIRAFGISVNRWEPANVLRALETGLVDAVQVIYNVFDQAPEDELLPACRELGIGVIARVPFDEGSLTGTLTADATWPEDDWRSTYFTPRNLAATLERVDALRADLPPGADLAEAALRFVVSSPDVTTVIPGMRRVRNVEANVRAVARGPLDAPLLARLRAHRWDRTLADLGTTRLPYVDGAFSVSPEARREPVLNPATGAPAGDVAVATTDDADRAVAAAVRAFTEWSESGTEARLSALARFADELDARADDLAALVTAEVGTPIKLSRRLQVGLPRTVLRSTLRLAAGLELEEEVGNSLVLREPVGVVVAIVPWNYPLHQAMCKVAPALAVGCTVVLKPASATPLNALALAEAADAAGLPAGVLNVVTGGGGSVGEHLVAHPDVDMVTFTGSTEGGRRVGALAAQTVKRVTLELGGKSACVVLDDADLERAVRAGVRNGLLNSGQTCNAWTRLIVPADRHDEACEIAAATAAAMRIGDPADEATQLGPLVSPEHRRTVEDHIARARADGLVEAYAGDLDPSLAQGAYLAPHVFGGVTPAHALAQEEVFGPVLAVMPARDEDDAVAIANSTMYGLSGAVFSADDERALRVARRLRTGQVDVNGGAFNPEAPMGGYRQSGNGRELGRYGLEEFLELKAVQR